MRRFLGLTVIPVVACLVLVGCGSSGSAPAATANLKVTATGAFGQAPTVNIPKLDASSDLVVRTLIYGSGPVFVKKDSLVANFALYFWQGKSSTLKASTYTVNPAIITGTMLPGLQYALIGKKVGSRVLAVVPPVDGYGTAGNSEIGVNGKTTLVFVIDLLGAYPATASASGATESSGGNGLPTVTALPDGAPAVTIPSSQPPATLQVQTLIKGAGPVIAKGQYLVVQYTGFVWQTKKVFSSSWQAAAPFGFFFQATPPAVIPGWDTGLAGQTVGSRVLLVIPPKDGYGKAGAPSAGIKGTDTLVYVVDILGAFQK